MDRVRMFLLVSCLGGRTRSIGPYATPIFSASGSRLELHAHVYGLMDNALLVQHFCHQVAAVIVFKTKFAIEALPGDVSALHLKMEGVETQLTAGLDQKLDGLCSHTLTTLISSDE